MPELARRQPIQATPPARWVLISLLRLYLRLKNLADISGEQVVNIGSQDMNNEVWLKLAKRVNSLLAQDNVDGIVITHGTDTMEETAYFLNLTVKSGQACRTCRFNAPVNRQKRGRPNETCTMPSSPLLTKRTHGRGVLVSMNDTVFGARDVTKTNTTSVQTFQSPNFGPLGYIHNSDVKYQRSPARQHTSNTVFDVSKLTELPKVGIVYNYASASDLPVKAYVDAKYDGIVSAGVGKRKYVPFGL